MTMTRNALGSAIALTILSLSGTGLAEDKPSSPDPKAHFRENGRIGVIGAITEDMWKGGLVFEHEYFEVQFLAHYGKYSETSRDFHLLSKVGGRVALGTLNYLAFGAELGVHPGSTDDNVDVGGAFQLGPYIGLQRYFAATPVMLNLWVNPYMYDHNIVNDGAGAQKIEEGYHLFQNGGFGVAYLFL